MSFGLHVWLFALPAILLGVVLLWIWSATRARQILRAAIRSPHLDRWLSSVAVGRRRFKQVLLAMGLAALVLALARPQWGRNEIEIERTGVDLVIALDVSRSMLAVDAERTNRLTVARAALERLLDELGGDRAALVVFAGEAFLAAPLTRDHTAVARALASANPDTVSEQGSNLGEAIKRARESFDRAAQGPKALLVVSDGEQLQGDALEAARAAAREGVQVHTASVGSIAGARVPRRRDDGVGFARNAMGREVVSRRDEQRLQQIATAGGGRYTRIERGDSAVLADWFQSTSAALPRTTEKRTVDEPRERFQWPLAFVLGLLSLEWILSDRRRERPQPEEPKL
jgi:Ca-activated chloride channel family protein